MTKETEVTYENPELLDVQFDNYGNKWLRLSNLWIPVRKIVHIIYVDTFRTKLEIYYEAERRVVSVDVYDEEEIVRVLDLLRANEWKLDDDEKAKQED